jgi:stress response protein YsnF
VTEREVAQDISLHEEHAQIMRRVVSDPNSIVDVDWADRTIHVVETAEHALVSKSARVVEEVELSKIGSDHVETVHEKLRRQQVEIERVGADGKRISRA